MPETELKNVTEIDEISEPKTPPTSPEDVPEQPDVPSHLQRHECGLWMIFVADMTLENEDGKGVTHYKAKQELVQYLQDHSIGHDDRKNLQLTDPERKYYELYTGVQRQNRVQKEHFVAALRLSHHGFDLWPQKTKNLNDMKVF